MLKLENPEHILTERQFVCESYPDCAYLHLYKKKKHYKIWARWMYTTHIYYTILPLWHTNYKQYKPITHTFRKYYSIWSFQSAQLSKVLTKKGSQEIVLEVCCRFWYDLNYALIPQSWLPSHPGGIEQLVRWDLWRHRKVWAVSSYFLADTDRCTVGQTSQNSRTWKLGITISVQLFQTQWITTWKRVFLYSIHQVFCLHLKKWSFKASLKMSWAGCITSIFYRRKYFQLRRSDIYY